MSAVLAPPGRRVVVRPSIPQREPHEVSAPTIDDGLLNTSATESTETTPTERTAQLPPGVIFKRHESSADHALMINGWRSNQDKITFVDHNDFHDRGTLRQARKKALEAASDIDEKIKDFRRDKRTFSLTAKEEEVLFKGLNAHRFKIREILSQVLANNSIHDDEMQALSILFAGEKKLISTITEANGGLVGAMLSKREINPDLHDGNSSGCRAAAEDALLRSIDGFDVAKGFKFSTYACRGILKAIENTKKKERTWSEREEYTPKLPAHMTPDGRGRRLSAGLTREEYQQGTSLLEDALVILGRQDARAEAIMRLRSGLWLDNSTPAIEVSLSHVQEVLSSMRGKKADKNGVPVEGTMPRSLTLEQTAQVLCRAGYFSDAPNAPPGKALCRERIRQIEVDACRQLRNFLEERGEDDCGTSLIKAFRLVDPD